MINYGILSTASIVPRFVKGIELSKDSKVYAICSRSLEKAKKTAEELNITNYFDDYDKMLDDKNIDIIYIANISFAHYESALKAIQKGKHVLLEKPFCLKKEEAVHLFEEAKKNDVFLMEAQKEVFVPLTKKLKKFIENGKIGKVHMLDFTTSFPKDYNDWILDVSKGGGVFFTNAVYTIEFIEYIFDRQIDLYSGMASLIENLGDSQCILNFKIGNTLAISKISAEAKLINKLIIYGEEGYFDLENFYRASEVKVHYFDDREDEVIKIPFENEMVFEIDHVSECIKNNKITSDVMTPERSIHAVEILEDIQKSFK